MTGTLLRMSAITKTFGEKAANTDVNFEVCAGEIHALIGENGAGKTTLMNIATGFYRQDSGELSLSGVVQDWASPVHALDAGLSMVHQTFSLVDEFTVAENVYLGTTRGLRSTPRRRMARAVAESAASYGIEMARPGEREFAWTERSARDLSPSEKQRVAILAALFRHCRVLILDEPTSVLSPEETAALFEVLRKLRDSGIALVFISHKVREVMALCDRVTVLRQGRVVETVPTSTVDASELATMMVGSAVTSVQRTIEARPATPPVLAVRGLAARGERGSLAFRDVDLTLHEGEVVGLAGVDGSGQHELVECIAGTRSVDEGSIDFVRAGSGRSSGHEHCGHIPADPRRTGLILDADAAWNVGLRNLNNRRRGGGRAGLVDTRGFVRAAKEIIGRSNVVNCTTTTRLGNLSGGNLQKFLVGREIGLGRPVLLVVNPTTGLDVRAIQAVRSEILGATRQGTGVLLASNDLDELLALCDRIVVFYNGEIAGALPGESATREAVGRLMSGLERPAAAERNVNTNESEEVMT